MSPITSTVRSLGLRCAFALMLITLVASRAYGGDGKEGGTPVGTTFTYQGSLKQSGSPVTGTHNLVFRLFDVPTGGSPLATSSLPGVVISNGLFTVAIDFGVSMFDGNARWLEIQVASSTLSPRQPMTAVPYALFALDGNQGPPGPPGPQGNPGTTGQSAVTVFGTAAVSPADFFILVPGLTQTINVSAGALVYVATDGGIQTTSAVATGVSRVDVAIYVDGLILANGAYRRCIVANTTGAFNMIGNWSISTTVGPLTVGSHTIDVRAFLQSGVTANVSGNNASPLQGELTVIIIKQ